MISNVDIDFYQPAALSPTKICIRQLFYLRSFGIPNIRLELSYFEIRIFEFLNYFKWWNNLYQSSSAWQDLELSSRIFFTGIISELKYSTKS